MLNVYHSKSMIFSEERNPEIFFGHILKFSADLLISCLPQILSGSALVSKLNDHVKT